MVTDDGSLITGGTIFVGMIALFVFAIGGTIIVLTLREWHRKSKEDKK